VNRTAIVLLSQVLCAAASTVAALDTSAFAPATFKNFQRQQPASAPGREMILDAAMPGLAVGVKYTGAIRPLLEARAAWIATVAKSQHRTELAALYAREIEVIEQGRSYWLPIQKEVLGDLSKTLNPGQEFTAYVRYTGSSLAVPGPFYLLVDFHAGKPKPPPRDTCFARQLFGIGLGQALAPVLEQLRAKYGEPHVTSRGQETLHVFLVDLATETYVVVGDAGEGYRDRVFSVQLTGRPGRPQAVFKSLRFGATPAELRTVFGKPERTVAGGEGYTRAVLPGTACSFELKDGVLAGIRIVDDPNYFQE